MGLFLRPERIKGRLGRGRKNWPRGGLAKSQTGFRLRRGHLRVFASTGLFSGRRAVSGDRKRPVGGTRLGTQNAATPSSLGAGRRRRAVSRPSRNKRGGARPASSAFSLETPIRSSQTGCGPLLPWRTNQARTSFISGKGKRRKYAGVICPVFPPLGPTFTIYYFFLSLFFLSLKGVRRLLSDLSRLGSDRRRKFDLPVSAAFSFLDGLSTSRPSDIE